MSQQPPRSSRIPPPSQLRTRSSASNLSASTSKLAPPSAGQNATSPSAKPRPLPSGASKVTPGPASTGPKRTTLRTVASQPRLGGSGGSSGNFGRGSPVPPLPTAKPTVRGSAPSTPTTPRTKAFVKPGPHASVARKTTSSSSLRDDAAAGPSAPAKPALSLKEQIALKRAEAKKAATPGKARSSAGDDGGLQLLDEDETWNGGRGQTNDAGRDDGDAFGRWSVKESIERSRTSGSLNISSRDLTHLPTALYTIQLGLTPERLPSQINDPPDDPNSLEPATSLAYYEVTDLTILKARDNLIIALQPELSLFGSLKLLDLRGNKLKDLPLTLSELSNLTHLDLSKNAFEAIPTGIFHGTTSLISLDLSDNAITALDFGDPAGRSTSLFESPRPTAVLPSLQILLLANNKIRLSSSTLFSPHLLPKNLSKVDLSGNPLCKPTHLVNVLGELSNLKELSLRKTDLEQGSFKAGENGSSPSFSVLKSLDLSENDWMSKEDVKAYLQACGRQVAFPGEKVPDAVQVGWGKKDLRESWELEAEARGQGKKASTTSSQGEEESGLVIGDLNGRPAFGGGRSKPVPKKMAIVVEKEQWELDAEEKHRTEAKQLQKRLAEMELAKIKEEEERVSLSTIPADSTLNRFYDSRNLTLTLPAAKAPPRTANSGSHGRSLSLKFMSGAIGFSSSTGKADDLNAPSETMPLVTIVSHDWAASLRVLVLSNRRADVVFDLPPTGTGLERLEELVLDGCNLGDDIRVRRPTGDSTTEVKEPLFGVLQELFQSLAVLDLSQNNLTKLPHCLLKLFFPEHGRSRGLKTLRLQGNRINDLEGLVEVAERFGRGESDGWCGEEVDIRDNDVGKLPPVLGLLQLDVFLVEGNSFRVPHRSVWQKEGTRGLLRWLKDSG